MNLQIIHLQETLSTNSYLRLWAAEHPQVLEAAVFTDSQTAGRGQRGNGWESEPGKNLTFSLLLHPSFIPADQQFILSQIASLAVREVLSEYTDQICVKWPNDIYWKDKKICGILIENDLTDGFISRSIFGIGVNLNQKIFLSDAPNPVSLHQITENRYDIKQIMEEITSAIVRRCHLLKNSPESWEGFRQEYARSLFRKEGFSLFENAKGRFSARIHHIEPSGLLVLEKEMTGEKEEFAFKEVKYVIG
jgi:BirA family biotin operon repressor/biotin-[acetyl-CoA-carboxylase] ligase